MNFFCPSLETHVCCQESWAFHSTSSCKTDHMEFTVLDISNNYISFLIDVRRDEHLRKKREHE
jgi:hypothetical protein